MTTILIPIPFARDGTKNPIENTSPVGAMNWTTGYTEDYSRELGADPASKAVERDKFNQLMYLVTSNIQDWQQFAIPQWLNGSPYTPPAFVRYTASVGQPEKIYRCLNNSAIGVPPTNTSFWEEVITTTALRGLIPMTDQKVVVNPTDFNSFATGFYAFAANAVIVGSANSPPGAGSGVLEVYVFENIIWQRYSDIDGKIYDRGRDGGGNWRSWSLQARSATTLDGYGITDGLYGPGPLGDAVNLNTLQKRGEAWARQSVPPANWAALNYPIQLPGALFSFGNFVASNNRVTAQYYHASNNSVWSRINVNGTWLAWQQLVFDPQVIINTILASNNTWTGTNTYQNAVNFRSSMGWQGYAVASDYGTSQEVGVRFTRGGRTIDYILAGDNSWGVFDRTAGRWLDYNTSDNATKWFVANQLVMNRDRLLAESAIYFQVQGLNTAGRIFADASGNMNVQAANINDNGYVSVTLARDGQFYTPSNVRAGGNLHANTAVFQSDGNVAGSAWGGEGLHAYVNNRNRYIFNRTGSNQVFFYWDGAMQMWVDSGYVGRVVAGSELAAYWPRNEFLRPDQGSWGSVNFSQGTTSVPLPGGGAWAYWLLCTDQSSGLSITQAGVAAGGTFISVGQVAPRAGAMLRWRIY